MLPRTLKDFMVYYWRFDPKGWALFAAQDIVHYTRYALAFMLVGQCVDRLSRATPSNGVPLTAWLMAGGILLVLGIGESAHIWTAHIGRKWKPRLRVRIRSDFFNYLLGHSHSYFQNNFAGALARKVTEVAESSVRLHDHIRFGLIGPLTSMVSAAVGLLIISPSYGLLMFLFIGTVIGPVILRLKRIGGRAREFSEVRSYVSGSIVDTLTNVSSTRNFARTSYEISLHTRDSLREEKVDGRRMLTLIQIEVYRRLCLVLMGGGMMLALLHGWRNGMVSVGDISAVMGLTFSLTTTTWILGYSFVMIADELGYIDDAIRMVTPPHEIGDRPDAKALAMQGGRVTFDHVDFKFGDRIIFANLNLDIAPGQKIGLIGPSGAGKSTLVNLLLRLYELNAGSVSIDGQDITAVTQESLRAGISLIPQDTALFHRSLRDNIRYGMPDATDEQVDAAARRAHAYDFIKELPEGYDTMVGERGIKLSGGQRQRIAIARAVLKDAPILLLDEATSALDSESEKLIQDSLFELMEGKTVIAIAHRLSTIAHMDRLLVMDRGAVVEDGSHRELLEKGGLYARLWGMQSGGFLGE